MNKAKRISKPDKQKNHLPWKSFFFQPKLTINQPDDIYEQEADAMADKVMRMPANKNENTFFKPANIFSIQRKCDHCEEEEKLQMKSEGSANAGMEAPSIVNDVINSGGQPLDTRTRNFFEPRFGHDFSDVRIHNDASAAKSAQSINALAYTSGNNIVFNQNQFSPGTDSGKKLLAHELTHVMQQEMKVIRRYGHDNFCDDNKHLIPFIWPGHAAALNMLSNTLAAFKNNDARLQYWIPAFFGKEGLKNIDKIQSKYLTIYNKLREHYVYHCNDNNNNNSDAAKCKGQRAETDLSGFWPSYDITMCFDVINQTWSAADLGALIIHENYHRAFKGSKHPWQVRGNPPDCSNNSDAANSSLILDNPDSYSCLAIIFS